MIKKINSSNAPEAIGPYSQAIEANGMIFVSGQLPIDPVTGTIPEGIDSQTRRSLENLKAVLSEAGSSLNNVCKTTVLLSDIQNFAAMNAVYAEYFSDPFPARIAYEVAAIPKGALVEIEAIAVK